MSGKKNNITPTCKALVWLLVVLFCSVPFVEAFHHHDGQQQSQKLSKQYNSGVNFKVNSKQCAICKFMLTKEAKLFYKSPSVFTIPHRIETAVTYYNTVQLYLSKDKLLFYGKSPPLV